MKIDDHSEAVPAAAKHTDYVRAQSEWRSSLHGRAIHRRDVTQDYSREMTGEGKFPKTLFLNKTVRAERAKTHVAHRSRIAAMSLMSIDIHCSEGQITTREVNETRDTLEQVAGEWEESGEGGAERRACRSV